MHGVHWGRLTNENPECLSDVDLRLAIAIVIPFASAAGAADVEVSPTASIGGYEAKFVDVNGIRTRYYEAGSGEPMILLHGAPWGGVASANTWVDNIATLSKHFHVYAFGPYRYWHDR